MKSIMLVIGLVVIGLLVAFGLLRTENRKESDAMNALMVIVPYKYEGLWVFDDAAVGLSKEPFIAGIDTLIDKATANIPDAQYGFRAGERAGSWKIGATGFCRAVARTSFGLAGARLGFAHPFSRCIAHS